MLISSHASLRRACGGRSRRVALVASAAILVPSFLLAPVAAQAAATPPATKAAATVTPPPPPLVVKRTIAITSHKARGTIDSNGATVAGSVTPFPPAGTKLTVAVVGKPETSRDVEVSEVDGSFAYRVFPEDIGGSGKSVSLTFTLTGSPVVTLALTSKADPEKVARNLFLSRLTFGNTPDLYARFNRQGFDRAAWLDEQIALAKSDDKIYRDGIWNDRRNGVAPDDGVHGKAQTWMSLWNLVTWERYFVAAYSDRQVRDVMAEFWSNHFFARSAGIGYTRYESSKARIEKYRDKAFSTFRELLFTTATDAAMMGFLTNEINFAGRRNENYAREILELHTITTKTSVPYTNDDIVAVSRIFTGWGTQADDDPDYDTMYPQGLRPESMKFVFRRAYHDTSDKYLSFLDKTIKGRKGDAGQDEGIELINILANHPDTKKNICGKLAGLLVSDDRPDWATQACIAAWGTDGDVKAMLKAIVLDTRYATTVAINGKVKTPLEFALGYIRNFGIVPDPKVPNWLFRMMELVLVTAGEDMRGFLLPTGFAEDNESWVGHGSLLAKANNSQLMMMNSVVDWGNMPGVTKKVTASNGTTSTVAASATAEAAAATLLGYTTNDRYTRKEFDLMVETLKSPKGFANPVDLTSRAQKAFRIIAAFPSYQLQ